MKTLKYILVLLIMVPAIVLSIPLADSPLKTKKSFHHEIYFKNTPNELNIYKIIGRTPGKNMLIIGGIHNEPGGYLTADHYVDMKLEKGSLTVVPRANFRSIVIDKRSPSGDMNRKFTNQNSAIDSDSKIVEILKNLISEADVLLNLHEGSGFYRSNYISKKLNPMKFGQSIIADTDVYHKKNSSEIIDLQEIAEEVARNVNKRIMNKEHYFRFNNHDTFSKKTNHPEQRKSATFYALSNHEIPAFGIESSSEIKDIESKVRHQIWIINEFMKLFDIVPEIPGLYLEYPELIFIIVSINNTNPIMVPDKKTLYIRKNDEIEIAHIESNYERGIHADVLYHGSSNDFRKRLKINKPTKIVIKKDKFACGEVNIKFKNEISHEPSESRYSEYEHIVIEIDGNIEVLDRNDYIDIIKGESIRLIDTVPSIKNKSNMRLNFYGFVPKNKKNEANDIGYFINTKTDLIRRFSRKGQGKIYDIQVLTQGEISSTYSVRLIQPELNYLTIRTKDKSYNIKNGDTISFKKGDDIIIEDLLTNIKNNRGIKVNFKGFVGIGNGEDRNQKITLNNKLLIQFSIENAGEVYPIIVLRNGNVFGKVFIRVI